MIDNGGRIKKFICDRDHSEIYKRYFEVLLRLYIGRGLSRDMAMAMITGGGGPSYDPNRLIPAWNMIKGPKNIYLESGLPLADQSFTIYTSSGDATMFYSDSSNLITASTFITPSFYMQGNTFTDYYRVFIGDLAYSTTYNGMGYNDWTGFRYATNSASTNAGLSNFSTNSVRTLWKDDNSNIFSTWTSSVGNNNSVDYTPLTKYGCFVSDGDIIWFGFANSYSNPVFTWIKLCKFSELTPKSILFVWQRLDMGGATWSQNCQIVRNLWQGILPWN